MIIKKLKTEKEWLAERKKVVTATELPVLLGLNKWQSPNKMMKEKVVSTFKGNSYTYIGQLLEEVVVQVTNDLLKDIKFTIIEEEGTKEFYRHEKLRLGATPDAINFEQEQFLECKTTKPLNYLRYSFNPPEYYVMQLMAQLMCAGWKTGYLSIMSTDLTQHSEKLDLPVAIFKVTLNDRLAELAEQEIERFWHCKEHEMIMRVDSKVKKEALRLIQESYVKVI